MNVILFTNNMQILKEWQERDKKSHLFNATDTQELFSLLDSLDESVVIVDYDSVAQELNKLISSNKLPKHTIVLEKVPEIASGKMLISHGVRAYGNSRMLLIHYEQMLDAILNDKVWTYPELTAALAKRVSKISQESQELIEHRLTHKELEIVYDVLDGLTNDAIATKHDITARTVKAHISSIFSKLHVSDRISLVLLLR